MYYIEITVVSRDGDAFMINGYQYDLEACDQAIKRHREACETCGMKVVHARIIATKPNH